RRAGAPRGAHRARHRLPAAPGPRAGVGGGALEADDLPAGPRIAAAPVDRPMKAAIMRAVGAPLAIEDIRLDTPWAREVVVRTVATGVCHSDLHVLEGSLPNPLPTVLGHEPAGVVEAVGSDVRHVAPGDHVIGCLSALRGTCEYCGAGRPYLCGCEAPSAPAARPPRLLPGSDA